MTASAKTEGMGLEAKRFSICGGWCRWLTCLTIIVICRQVGNAIGGNYRQLPPVTAKFVVELNSADASELQALPEVGTALAGRIVQHRQTHGPFTTVEELLDVPGVGPRTLEQLRPMLATTPPR